MCFSFSQRPLAAAVAQPAACSDPEAAESQPGCSSAGGFESGAVTLPSATPAATSPDNIDLIMDRFQQHLLPTQPGPGKTKESRQCRSRVRRWIDFVCGPRATDLKGLTGWTSWSRWMASLHLSLMPTTVNNHLIDYRRFLAFLKLSLLPADVVGLTASEIDIIANWVANEKGALGPKIREHRFNTLEKKTSNLLSGGDLAKFIDLARDAIPASLKALATDPQRLKNVHSSAGLLAAYLLTYTGMRRSCIVGLETREVMSASLLRGGSDGARVLRLGRHKTSPIYGPSRTIITAVEHRWLLEFIARRRFMKGYSPENKFVFFNGHGKPMEKITAHVRAAYQRLLGRPGVTPTALRTALATFAKRSMTTRDQVLRARLMGQTVATRNTHYVAMEAPDELMAARQTLDNALLAARGTQPRGEVRQPWVSLRRCPAAEALLRAQQMARSEM